MPSSDHSPHSIDILINTPQWGTAVPDCAEMALKAVNAVFKQAENLHMPDAQHPVYECSINFSDDASVKALNKQFRGKDKPTNVLSFAALDGNGDDVDFHHDSLHLGDIILAFETVNREAKEHDKTMHDHSTHLIVHGVLHLLGYTHDNEAKADKMESLEINILEKLNVKNPYLISKTMA